MTLNIVVCGTPAPQGSKKFVGRAKSGRGIMIESSKAVAPWRATVAAAAVEAIRRTGWQTATGPVVLEITFLLRAPKKIRKEFHGWPCAKPDLSKLVRSTEDALTDAGVWVDDSRVIEMSVRKVYDGALWMASGAYITVYPKGQ